MHERVFVAFLGTRLLGRGSLQEMALAAKALGDPGALALFDDETGQPTDVDLTGDEDEVRQKLAQHPLLRDQGTSPAKPRGPGRPKLGVVSREVSLLPRHWEWLAQQQGGASASLRRLVEGARKTESSSEHKRRAITAAHRFMWDIAGDLPGFEDACRALFAGEFATLSQLTARWPEGIREQLERFTARAQ